MEVGRRSLFRTREMTCEVPGLSPNLFLRQQDECGGFLYGRAVCSKDKGRAYHPAGRDAMGGGSHQRSRLSKQPAHEIGFLRLWLPKTPSAVKTRSLRSIVRS
jgi:hypothetical protein